MRNDSPRLSKSEIAAIDIIIQEARANGGTITWTAMAARLITKAASAAEVTKPSNIVNTPNVIGVPTGIVVADKPNIESLSSKQKTRLLKSLKGGQNLEELTLNQLIEIRNKI